MSERDYETYCNLYQAISTFLPPPSLIVYLKASVETLSKRIQHRGRDFEKDMSRDYLMQLNALYDDWISDWTACRVLTIETDGMDFQHNQVDYENILGEIQDALRPVI